MIIVGGKFFSWAIEENSNGSFQFQRNTIFFKGKNVQEKKKKVP